MLGQERSYPETWCRRQLTSSAATAVTLGRVGLSRHNLDPRTTTMTDNKTALRALLEKGSDATFLREMIGFAAERLMQLETEAAYGAAPGERSAGRTNQRMAIASAIGRPGRAPSSCGSRAAQR